MNQPPIIAAPERSSWPVTVVLRREMRQRGQWEFPAWTLQSIEQGATESRLTETRIDDGVREFRWSGLAVVLLRSNAETFWYNLTSARPSLFVICQEDPQYGLMPIMVTLDQDESARQQESETEIFRMDPPTWLLEEVERFVMAHYQPEDKRGKKRRRKPQEQTDEF